MARILIIGNAGGGKSVLARKVAAKRNLPYREIDTIVWKPGWEAFSRAEYETAHAVLIAEDAWVLDGLANGAVAYLEPETGSGMPANHIALDGSLYAINAALAFCAPRVPVEPKAGTGV